MTIALAAGIAGSRALPGLLAGGLVLLTLGGTLLVRGASDLARAFGLSPLVIGLTVVAFGTSAPELAASVAAGLRGEGDIAFGNVVGSNIFNVLLILGASALITPLVVAQKLVRLDVPIMIGLSFLVLGLGANGWIGRFEGALLVAGLVAYVIVVIRCARVETDAVRSEYAREYADPGARRGRGGAMLVAAAGAVVLGLALLVWGSRWLVAGAAGTAQALGASEFVIGLTIVAAGTSLPEVVTSLLAAAKGERDIAVGNVVGSNIFNILGVLGLAAIVAPDGIAVSPAALRFDVPVMIAAAVACLPIFFTGHRIFRGEATLLLAYYGAYVAFLVLDAVEHDHLPVFSGIMLAFVLPLTAVGLAITVLQELRARRRRGPASAGRKDR
jgi:cation:H+ antiporter